MSKNIILQLHKTRKQTNNCEALFKSTREKIPMEKYRFICTFYKRKLVSDTSINYKGTKQKEGDTMWGAAVWNVRKHPGMRITKKKNKLHATKIFSAVKSNTQSCQREEKLKQNNKTFFSNLEGMHLMCVWMIAALWLVNRCRCLPSCCPFWRVSPPEPAERWQPPPAGRDKLPSPVVRNIFIVTSYNWRFLYKICNILFSYHYKNWQNCSGLT